MAGGHLDNNSNEGQRRAPLSLSEVELHRLASENKWNASIKDIFIGHPSTIGTQLSDKGDTVLHVAASSSSFAVVRGLMRLEFLTGEHLEMKNSDGNTAFHIAVSSNFPNDILKLMTQKNPNLPLIYGQDQMLPVHLAASSGQSRIPAFLSSDDLLGKMTPNDIVRLFFLTIRSDYSYGVANKLLDKYIVCDWFVYAKDDDQLTALEVLARRPFSNALRRLVGRVWDRVSQLNTPSTVLFDAIRSGNHYLAVDILSNNRTLRTLREDHGRHVLHLAALHGGAQILRYLEVREINMLKNRDVDEAGNNVLHLAAKYQSKEGWSTFNTKKLRSELAWFERVQGLVQPELGKMTNNEGKTPTEIFYDNHRELFKEEQETVRGIANSGIVVAALIASVAFAAALADVPRHRTGALFVVFILMNAIALFASSSSIISFLSIFTLPLFVENKFVISLTPIKLGLGLLTVSVVAMVLSFAAVCFLLFGQVFKWAGYVVVAIGVVPILMPLILWFNNSFHDLGDLLQRLFCSRN